ncbi:hypothetical protein BH11PLA2_BH11PLA2_50770 [soil metagenome]
MATTATMSDSPPPPIPVNPRMTPVPQHAVPVGQHPHPDQQLDVQNTYEQSATGAQDRLHGEMASEGIKMSRDLSVFISGNEKQAGNYVDLGLNIAKGLLNGDATMTKLAAMPPLKATGAAIRVLGTEALQGTADSVADQMAGLSGDMRLTVPESTPLLGGHGVEVNVPGWSLARPRCRPPCTGTSVLRRPVRPGRRPMRRCRVVFGNSAASRLAPFRRSSAFRAGRHRRSVGDGGHKVLDDLANFQAGFEMDRLSGPPR